MERRDLTQVELGQQIGVSQPTVQRWLKGSMPNAEEFFKLSVLLDVPMTSFFDKAELSRVELLNDAPTKKNGSRLTKIADALAEQLADLRKAIIELEK